jgi:Protein of unknown function (DUF3592)
VRTLLLRAVGIACVAVGGASFFELAAVAVASVRSSSWPVATGEVLSSEVFVRRTGKQWHKPEIHYSYSVGGVSYVNTRVWFVAHGGTLEGTAQEVVAAFPRNASVSAHYNPSNPAQSALLPGLELEPVLGAALSILVSLAGVVLFRDARRVKVVRRAA